MQCGAQGNKRDWRREISIARGTGDVSSVAVRAAGKQLACPELLPLVTRASSPKPRAAQGPISYNHSIQTN
jgi:hypothetical protein